jgi:hypothetical protein
MVEVGDGRVYGDVGGNATLDSGEQVDNGRHLANDWRFRGKMYLIHLKRNLHAFPM